MAEHDDDLRPGWTLNQRAIAETQDFWEKRSGVRYTPDEAREVMANMAAFVDILQGWHRASNDTKEATPEQPRREQA